MWSAMEEREGEGEGRTEEEGEGRTEEEDEEEEEEEEEEGEETQDMSIQFDSAASNEDGENEVPTSLPSAQSGRRLVEICASPVDGNALGEEVQHANMSYLKQYLL